MKPGEKGSPGSDQAMADASSADRDLSALVREKADGGELERVLGAERERQVQRQRMTEGRPNAAVERDW